MISVEKLGTRIVSLRKACGLTQIKVAEHLGVTPQAVSKWERGLACPDLIFLDELSDLLGVSIDTLLRGETCEIIRPDRFESVAI